MVYRQSAERNWRRLRGFECLAKAADRVQFRDRIKVQNEMRVIRKHQPGTVAA